MNRNPARVAFLNREIARDIDAEVAQGVNRAWLEAIVADARRELAILTGQPLPAEPAKPPVRWDFTEAEIAQIEREERAMGVMLRRAARQGRL